MTGSVMAHMIPYYPDLERSRSVARALIDGGAAYLEIQFPYSDPTADGPAIQEACSTALSSGFRISSGWEFIRELTSAAGGCPPIFLMSYAGLVYAYGVERFAEKAASLGVTALIIPDLPLDADEGLLAAGKRHGVEIVPVIAFGAHPKRIQLILNADTRYIYASLRRGITGSRTEISEENIAFIDMLGKGGASVMAGFGIVTRDQVTTVTDHAHAAVIGSAFVRCVRDAVGDPYQTVLSLATELCGTADTV